MQLRVFLILTDTQGHNILTRSDVPLTEAIIETWRQCPEFRGWNFIFRSDMPDRLYIQIEPQVVSGKLSSYTEAGLYKMQQLAYHTFGL
jgi:hypothetical protein